MSSEATLKVAGSGAAVRTVTPSRKHWLRKLSDCGHAEDDGPDSRRQKSVITGASILKTAACPLWVGFFLAVAAPVAAAIPLFYGVFTWMSIGRMARNKDIAGFRTRQAWLILLLPAGVSMAMGGLVAGGAVALWSFLAPLIVLLFHGPRASVRWLMGFFAVVTGAVVIEVFELLPAVAVAPTLLSIFTAMNVIVVAGISYAAVRYYAFLLHEEQDAKLALSVRIDGLEGEVEAARKAGSYRLMEPLGQGGMGEVWRAEHAMLARPAAVKLIRPVALEGEQSKIEQVMRRFEREAQATASLTSANTVEVYDFGHTAEGDFYYVMELLNGLNLEELVRRFGPLPSARVAHLLAQACDSLYEAHEVGLIHRDIKPANLFACRRGNRFDVVKVLDFGLVKPFLREASAAKLTAEGSFAATPSYTSPESVLDPDGLDGRSDIYLLGCVGYWLTCGCPPFEGSTPFKVVQQHATAAPTLPSARTELDIDPELERIILSCMAKFPEERPPDAAVLRKALLPVADGWSEESARSWWEKHHPLPRSSSITKETRRAAEVRFAKRSGQVTAQAQPDQTFDQLSVTTNDTRLEETVEVGMH